MSWRVGELKNNETVKIKVGFGFDTHKLTEGRDLMLGGVSIPHEKGALGHSDADVLIHAIIDALLGAAGLPDIGFQFPDSDPQYKNVDSKILLRKTLEMICTRGFAIGNIDTTIVLQRPKIQTFIPVMQHTLSQILNLSADQLTVKAKTSENLGFIGREEGISAYATVLLEKTTDGR